VIQRTPLERALRELFSLYVRVGAQRTVNDTNVALSMFAQVNIYVLLTQKFM
jgi:hypothetical protein